MTRTQKQITLARATRPLETTVALVAHYSKGSYYIFENNEIWYIGLGTHSSLTFDAQGQTATTTGSDGQSESTAVTGSPTDLIREFVSEYSSHGKIFGQVGFNYSARCSGQAFESGQWPMLNLIVPSVGVIIERSKVTITGDDDEDIRRVSEKTESILEAELAEDIALSSPVEGKINLNVDAQTYQTRVANAIADISEAKYTKAIPSRKVPLDFRVDMLATLLHGRRANNPARTFSFNHNGIQATGFSPEVLLSINGDKAYTEALAGTQLSDSAKASLDPFNNKLHDDIKEVAEHVIAIKGSIRRLSKLCEPESIAIKDFMKVMPRGSVQHLHSHVCGSLKPGCDGWDALPGLIANITVPGLPGEGNSDAMKSFEPDPRDLYCGAVLMLDEGSKLFDATLVLRTVFQDESRQWLQAGAGVTINSKPEREYAETCEKLGSVAPFVVPASNQI
ncbi:salicylate synthetase [Aspergillus eucalypticola CBS 122712]|uniref:Salicylate synthetase n=1 Tax=Aspergillus eucalypticola (strain CBS 122712 / IBT 29274) TaxID=1448314 RepID=A0A317VQE1_ASPEC|nr:salicylate synthetase [Aspergillus eucalypticola CBS 122712]PWY75769.1 salicylate synthetase [Aspergillus eucalypticola CBS 122712]